VAITSAPLAIRFPAAVVCCLLLGGLAGDTWAQARNSAGSAATAGSPAAAAATVPGFRIGIDDLLSVRFWGDDKLSVDVVVRSDGKISLPLLNDVHASGLTPEELGDQLEKAASKYVAEPSATVIVREIRSRKVYVLGQVARPGVSSLNTETNVLQLLASVGGVLEYADKGNIMIIRKDAKAPGGERRFKFDYNEVVKGKKLEQNIQLQPDDTIVVN
jgi:polysaccharide biosynthesis/export protein